MSLETYCRYWDELWPCLVPLPRQVVRVALWGYYELDCLEFVCNADGGSGFPAVVVRLASLLSVR